MKESNRTKNTFRNSVWGLLSKIIGLICPFIFRAIIIRKLGAEYVGLNGLFKSVLNVLNMTELGFGSAIIYMMYKPIAEGNVSEVRSLLNSIRKIYKGVGLTILVMGCFVYPVLNILVKNDTGANVNIYLLYTMYLFNVVVSYLSFAYCTTIFTAHQRSDVLSKIGLAVDIVRYFLQAIVLAFTKNYYLYLLVFSLSVIPYNILCYYASRKMYPDLYCEGSITKEQRQEIKEKVVPLLGHRIGGKVIVSIDDLIISSFLGISYLTQYDNYYYIFFSITSLLTVIRGSVIASLGNKIYSSPRDELYAIYKKIYFLWVLIVGWCTCCLAGLFQPFIEMWVGKKYVYTDAIMLCICAYFFCWQFRFIGVTMKDAAGLWEPDRWKPIIGMVLNLVFSIIVVKITGSVVGVLLPTMAIMVFLYFPWETYVLFKYVFKRSSKEYLRLTARVCFSVLLSVSIVYLITRIIPSLGIGFFVVRMVICVIVPILVFSLINFKTEEFKYMRELVSDTIQKQFGKSTQ